MRSCWKEEKSFGTALLEENVRMYLPILLRLYLRFMVAAFEGVKTKTRKKEREKKIERQR